MHFTSSCTLSVCYNSWLVMPVKAVVLCPHKLHAGRHLECTWQDVHSPGAIYFIILFQKQIMKKAFLFFTVVLILAGESFSQSKDETAVRDLLTVQSVSWNNGNLEGFMESYWKNDSLMFIGKKGVTYGWQNTLENYKKNYPDTVNMGKLRFELLEVNRLSEMYFFVIGKWFLTRSVGDLNGSFTLVVKKIKDQWVIVADHSS